MRLIAGLERPFHRLVDRCYENVPQPAPDKARLRHCKIVSHRGEHDNKTVFENTISAFDRIRDQGVWGIECDIRWTKDLHPVVFHDQDCRRLFGSKLTINEATLAELKTHFPLIPSLQEVIARYGGKLHLMLEIKEEHYPTPDYQRRALQELIAALEPKKDFHLISLSPGMFRFIDFVPPSALLTVAQLNVRRMSQLTMQRRYGGVTGHYLLLKNQLLKRHQELGQQIGTGFVASKNCLFRELNRGVEWIFSNHAIKLKKICDEV